MNLVIGILILALACLGNATWWVVMVNRRHAAALPEWRLKGSRLLHDAGILVFPPAILWLAGIGKTGLLTGGRFEQQATLTQGVLLFAATGTVPLVLGVLRWQLRGTPPVLANSMSKRFDVLGEASSEQHRDDVRGCPRSLLARLPRNEIYQLEVNEQQLDLSNRFASPCASISDRGSGVPAGHSLTVAHFSDLHIVGCPGRGYFDFVADRLCEMCPDAFLFTGDLLDDMALLPWATEIFTRLASVAPGYFVLGNHDWQLDHETIRSRIVEAGWTNLAGRSEHCSLNGTPLMLAGTEMPWIGSSPVVPSRSGESLRILLSHSPDERDFARTNDFDLMLSGHNHGGQVILPVIGPVYSPSRHGVRYAGGLFQHQSLTIHVSRGVGAKDPLRWNCLPEITRINLTHCGSDAALAGAGQQAERANANS